MRYIALFLIWISGCIVISVAVDIAADASDFPRFLLGLAGGILWGAWLSRQIEGD